MKYLASYLLLGLGGNTSPSADDIKGTITPSALKLPVLIMWIGVLESVGLDVDDERVEKLCTISHVSDPTCRELTQSSV